MMSDLLTQLTGMEWDLKQSILTHVCSLLNTRQGSLQHMLDYGMPCYPDKQQDLREKELYKKAMIKAIKRYEPRLTSLRIKEVNNTSSILQWQLEATIVGVEPFCFTATLDSEWTLTD